MKIKKSLLSVFLCISLMCGCLSPSISVYASNGDVVQSGSNFLQNWWDKSISFVSGCITTSIDYTKDFIQHLTNHKSDYNIPENTTPEEWIDDNVTVDNQGNVIYSDNIINSMRDCINNYVLNESGYQYVYSYNTLEFLQKFSDQEHYHAFRDFISEYDNSYYIAYHPYRDVFCLYDANGGYFASGETSAARPWVILTKNWSEFSRYAYCTYDSSNHTYIVDVEDNLMSAINTVTRKDYTNGPNLNYDGFYLIDSETTQYLFYNSLDALRAGTEGVQQYYVSDSYNTSHTDNSITTTIGDINRQITYGDVSTYVNNYYTTNNNYPTSNQVYNYINNYDGSGSGGSGGSDDDDDDDDATIWELLKKVLDFISHIFDLIADFLANLVDSLGDIVESIINSIFDIFNAIKDDIPNAIGGLLDYLFPFLPSEVLVLIKFSIACSIIIGLIKLIRG